MKIKKIILPIVAIGLLTSCAAPIQKVQQTSQTTVVYSQAERIAVEIGLDNYAKGVWDTKDFKYTIELIGQVDLIRYYEISFQFKNQNFKYIVKADFDSWEIVRVVPYQP